MCGWNCDRTHPLRKYDCVVVIARTVFIYEGVRHANSWQSRIYRPDNNEHAMNSSRTANSVCKARVYGTVPIFW
jgi:hypothetical protein